MLLRTRENLRTRPSYSISQRNNRGDFIRRFALHLLNHWDDGGLEMSAKFLLRKQTGIKPTAPPRGPARVLHPKATTLNTSIATRNPSVNIYD